MAIAVCLTGLAGCASRGTTLTTASTVTVPQPSDLGADDWLRDVSTLEATALVTAYDADGAAHVSVVQLTVDVNAGKVRATCNIPGGSWRAAIALDGWGLMNPIGWDSVSARGDASLTEAQREQIAERLRLILHRLRGPVNVLGGGERIVASDRMTAGAHDLTRLRVEGRPSLVAAYYFDESKAQLRMVAQGGYEPGDTGTMTVYHTERTADGVVLPVRLEVTQLGVHGLIGSQRILSVRLKDISLR
jgi:hypothetical protein